MTYSVTEAFVSWLAGKGYQASTRPPKTGDEFVTVERVGGLVADMVDHPQMAVQTWAKTEPRAEEMANAVRLALVGGDVPRGVHHVAVDSGPYAYFDEDTRLPRYQLSLDCTAQLAD